MKTLILGSGFGLYGYLPAAYKISNKIFFILGVNYKTLIIKLFGMII